jgi:hypothetical protein
MMLLVRAMCDYCSVELRMKKFMEASRQPEAEGGDHNKIVIVSFVA